MRPHSARLIARIVQSTKYSRINGPLTCALRTSSFGRSKCTKCKAITYCYNTRLYRYRYASIRHSPLYMLLHLFHKPPTPRAHGCAPSRSPPPHPLFSQALKGQSLHLLPVDHMPSSQQNWSTLGYGLWPNFKICISKSLQ